MMNCLGLEVKGGTALLMTRTKGSVMNWGNVGSWLQDNAASGAGLIGSLLTGNVVGAISAGASMVSSATGTNDPLKALNILKTDPVSMARLKELQIQEDASIRQRLKEMTELELKDKQAEHKETQETIRGGDNSEDTFVRRTRPAQAWLSLMAALAYVFMNATPDFMILSALLTLPFSYAGLRQIGKGINSITAAKMLTK